MLKFLMPWASKAAFIVIAALAASTAYLTVANKAKQAEITAAKSELAQQQQANRQFAGQLAKANQQITDFLQQTAKLQQQVKNLQQQQQERHYAITQQLAKNKAWADSPVPDDVSRLFGAAGVAPNPIHAATLPNRKPVPNATGEH